MAGLIFFGVLLSLVGFLLSPVVGAVLLVSGKRKAGIGVMIICPVCMVLAIAFGAASFAVGWRDSKTVNVAATEQPFDTLASTGNDITGNSITPPLPTTTTAPPIACNANDMNITESFLPSTTSDVNVSFDITNNGLDCTLNTNAMKVGVTLSDKTHLVATSEAGDDGITIGQGQVTSFSLDFANAQVNDSCTAISKYDITFGQSTNTFAPNDLAMCPSGAPTMTALSAPEGNE